MKHRYESSLHETNRGSVAVVYRVWDWITDSRNLGIDMNKALVSDQEFEEIKFEYTPRMALDNIVSDLGHILDRPHVFPPNHIQAVKVMLAQAIHIAKENDHIK